MSILYVVGTPIGNLGDLSPRAVKILKEVDFIAAEDTRVTIKLLNHFDIKKSMVSYFEHNKIQRGEVICSRILKGEKCALVSDAGMPAISDPGEELVAQCIEKDIKIEVIPGPSAVISAIAVSGLKTGRFAFEGFLSVNKKSRKIHLEQIKDERRTIVFYEAPHKLASTLSDLFEVLGDRKIAIARELTKIHEEVIRTTLKQAAQRYSSENIRGEVVLVVEGAGDPRGDETALTLNNAVELANLLISEGKSIVEASREAAKISGIPKRDIYKCICAGKN